MLSVKSVNQYYGQNHILWDINLEFIAGNVLASSGETASEKPR